MTKQTLRFASTSSFEASTYRFLELPPELAQLVNDEITDEFTIKGDSQDDAVLCTADKTYTVRSVVLSNLVLVVTGSPDPSDQDSVVVRDQVQEILELAPCLPKLQRLGILLRGMEYDEGLEMEDQSDAKNYLSYEEVRAAVQASDSELAQGLIDRRILIINGFLRPMRHSYLTAVLEQMLNVIVASSFDHRKAPIAELVTTLWDEHEIPQAVANQVTSWFGKIKDGLWAMDVEKVVAEVGLGILRNHKHEPIGENDFMNQWNDAVGISCEGIVKVDLLLGNYLYTLPQTQNRSLLYFPASELSTDPATRFADLFLTRPRWSSDDITPFLVDLAISKKDRDKLLLKYARAIKNGDAGTFYTARVQYTG